jgi:hypothetical protein
MARMKAPESLAGESTYLEHNESNAGTYLFVVTDSHDGAYKIKDDLKTCDGFSFDLEVVGGPNAGKSFSMTFFNGKLNSKDGGAFAAKKQFAALIATDVCTPEQLGKEFDYDPTEATGSLFVAELELGQKNDDGKRYLQLAWSNIYHVDDPRIANVKMDDDQRAKIASIKPAYRHPKDYFAKLLEKKQDKSEKTAAAKPNFDDL